MMRLVAMVFLVGCGHITFAPDAAVDAPVDVSSDAAIDATGIPCRAPTVEGGIEYDCIFAGTLGVCAGSGEPTCWERCPVSGCDYGEPHQVTTKDGVPVCWCE